MSKKQWIWLAVALAVFIAAGVITAWQTNLAADRAADVLDIFQAGFPINGETQAFPDEDFIARVDIDGTIMSSDSGSLALSSGGFDGDFILDYIERLIDCPRNVGILLYVNSGGGEINLGDTIYLKLMDYKNETGRPIYAYFDDLACSAAYYIAMAADEIYANRNSVCVNIGVYYQTYNLSGLFEKYGIEEITIKSSENKAIGAIGAPWTDEQREIYQSMVDIWYDQFVDIVADGRGMTNAQVRKLDDGREMAAIQALEAGFIDGIARYEDYEEQVLGYFGDAVLYEELPAASVYSLLDYFYGRLRALVPVSDLQLIRDLAQSGSRIVVMSYAG